MNCKVFCQCWLEVSLYDSLLLTALQETCDMPIPPFFYVYYVYFKSHWFLGKEKEKVIRNVLAVKILMCIFLSE